MGCERYGGNQRVAPALTVLLNSSESQAGFQNTSNLAGPCRLRGGPSCRAPSQACRVWPVKTFSVAKVPYRMVRHECDRVLWQSGRFYAIICDVRLGTRTMSSTHQLALGGAAGAWVAPAGRAAERGAGSSEGRWAPWPLAGR